MSSRLGKLGRKPARHDPLTLPFARYLTGELPAPPESVDLTQGVGSWPMMGNDELGDCTCAAAGHLIEAWTQAAKGAAQVIPDSAVLAAYEAVGGYVPGDPSTDQGADELTVLKYWRKTGIGGHKIAAFVAVDPQNSDHVRQAIALFGGLYLGIAMPLSAQEQTIWDVPAGGPVGSGAPGSWGGHAVPQLQYDPKLTTVITWGQKLQMTWEFFSTYVDEAWAIVTPDWIEQQGDSPSGFSLAALRADLALVAGGP